MWGGVGGVCRNAGPADNIGGVQCSVVPVTHLPICLLSSLVVMIGTLSSRSPVENVTSIESVPRSATPTPTEPIDVASELPGGLDAGVRRFWYVAATVRERIKALRSAANAPLGRSADKFLWEVSHARDVLLTDAA